MQKSLLTMVLALALPTAYAQSSVTLYGIVDVGIESLDVGRVTQHAPAKRNFGRLALGHSRIRGFGRGISRRVHA